MAAVAFIESGIAQSVSARHRVYGAAMGEPMPVECPVEGCDYRTTFRVMSGDTQFASEWEAKRDILRGEHPAHPTK